MAITLLGAWTALHTALSLVALVCGAWVVAGLLRGGPGPRLQRVFWGTALATSLTGFVFPFHGMTPALAVGVVASAILLVLPAAARAPDRRPWALVHAGGLVASVYLLVFVAIAQAFGKLPPLHALAPTLKEPPFALAQALALLLFLVLGILAARRCMARVRPAPAHP